MISFETLVSFFEDTRNMKQRGECRFDIDQLCRWSFFMVDHDREKLTLAGRHLESEGYEIVGFLDPSEESERQEIYLRFDKVECHTPETLFKRNDELYGIARQFELEDYDGMDVGAVDGP